ncbi:MAG TPA: hypothetical protein VFU47_14380 [Armatimonadota bacterium]|nr:hypothetical protein [Armatimonadota bacterium]
MAGRREVITRDKMRPSRGQKASHRKLTEEQKKQAETISRLWAKAKEEAKNA